MEANVVVNENESVQPQSSGSRNTPVEKSVTGKKLEEERFDQGRFEREKKRAKRGKWK